MKEIIDLYRDIVIQIATPYSKGTGFYLKDKGLIVTNEHVVRGNREVVIDGRRLQRQMVNVLYTDQRYDLAFLEAPEEEKIPAISLGKKDEVKDGDQIIAIGHPFGLKYTTTKGIISSTLHQVNEINYFQHDAALNPGNSGGPLLNTNGEIIGVNTFVIKEGDNIGFSLPIQYLIATLEEYLEKEEKVGVRCTSCANIVFEKEVASKYCPHCGAHVILPSQEEVYEPVGVGKTIEDILIQTGHDVRISRRGPNHWEIQQGSAKINITYHEKTGLIIGDAYLCNLPKDNIKPIYEFLLKQNYQIEGLTFSVNPKGQDIILSLLIYDRYLNEETGIVLFKYLFEKADHFDNILVEEFGAVWKEEE